MYKIKVKDLTSNYMELKLQKGQESVALRRQILNFGWKVRA